MEPDIINECPHWGTYLPAGKSRILRRLAQMGFGRGACRHLILNIWQKNFGNIVDIEVRGIKYRLDISNNVTDRQILGSSIIYDKYELTALARASTNKVFVDIGANIGYYSLHMAKSGAAQVVAIEPNPPALTRLRFNTDINALQKKIHIYPVGIGKEEGVFKLFSSGDLGSASLVATAELAAGAQNIEVRPLIPVLNELGITEIGGLKIDVEGVEDQALLPFFENTPKTMWPACIVIEHSSQHLWDTNIIDFIIRQGYSCKHRSRGNTTLMSS